MREQSDVGRRLAVGDKASVTRSFSPADVAAFAEITGDRNPVHLDQAYAAQTQFQNRIVHGILTAGLISAILGTELPGPGCIYLGQNLKFIGPVFIGSPVTAHVEVIKIRDDKPIVTLHTSCVNEAGELVVDGEAVVRVPWLMEKL
jgi:acyl dehydratase